MSKISYESRVGIVAGNKMDLFFFIFVDFYLM